MIQTFYLLILETKQKRQLDAGETKLYRTAAAIGTVSCSKYKLTISGNKDLHFQIARLIVTVASSTILTFPAVCVTKILFNALITMSSNNSSN